MNELLAIPHADAIASAIHERQALIARSETLRSQIVNGQQTIEEKLRQLKTVDSYADKNRKKLDSIIDLSIKST
jgi:hypothetical protein